jgi:DNA-binding MarR family transcriptional regulator
MLFAAMPIEGIRQADLARRLGVSRQAVNELVSGLERAALVERIPDPSSGRSKLVRPTARGRQSIDAALAIFERLEHELRGRIGNLSVDVLREVLDADWGPETR